MAITFKQDVEGVKMLCHPEQWGNWVCLVVNVLALTFGIVGISTDYWVAGSGTNSVKTLDGVLELDYDTHAGIWKVCGQTDPNSPLEAIGCTNWEDVDIDDKIYLRVSQAFVTMFVIFQTLIVALFIVGFWEADYREYGAEKLLTFNAFNGLIGTIIFAVWSVPKVLAPGCVSSCTELDYSAIIMLIGVLLLPMQMVCFSPCNSCECLADCVHRDGEKEDEEAPTKGGDDMSAPLQAEAPSA